MTTGQRMKLRRKELNKSAEELAKTLGVSPATIYRYEKGDIEKVPGDFLEPLAKALDTTPAWLMGWEEPQKTLEYIEPDDDIIRIQRARSKMSDSEKAHMMETLKMVYTKYFTEGYDEDTKE